MPEIVWDVVKTILSVVAGVLICRGLYIIVKKKDISYTSFILAIVFFGISQIPLGGNKNPSNSSSASLSSFLSNSTSSTSVVVTNTSTSVAEDSDNGIRNLVIGTWRGTYTAGQGITGADLIITDYDGEKITALFYFYPVSENPDVPVGCYHMEGTISSDLHIVLNGTEWIQQPNDYDFLNIDGTIDQNSSTLISSQWSLSVAKISDSTDTSESQKRIQSSTSISDASSSNEDSSSQATSSSEEPYFFSKIFETHDPDDAATQVSLYNWDSTNDKDIRGNFHVGETGYKLSASNLFNAFGGGLENDITSKIHFVRNEAVPGRNLTLSVMAADESAGSPASATITVFVDGQQQGEPSAPITGETVDATTISIDATNCEDEIIIQTDFIAWGNGLTLGYFLS